MNRIITFLLCVGFLGMLSFSGRSQSVGISGMIINRDIQLFHLKDSVFVHVSWDSLPDYGRFSSNGLIVVKNAKALMVDTPMDTIKTLAIVNYLEQNWKVEIQQFIPGHYHSDCLGGLEALHRKGVNSLAHRLTIEKCLEQGLSIPHTAFSGDTVWLFQGLPVECFYPGGGHTIDNIVIYFRDQKILFGGCLVKSSESKGKGNISDAILDEWPLSIRKVNEHFPDTEIVIPGHGKWGGRELLAHTLRLVEDE